MWYSMTKKHANARITARIGSTLAQIRHRSKLSQAEVARRMGTSQAAIARLEAGRQSPSVGTLQDFARANGYCLEIGFLPAPDKRTGCVLVVHGSPDPEGTGPGGRAG